MIIGTVRTSCAIPNLPESDCDETDILYMPSKEEILEKFQNEVKASFEDYSEKLKAYIKEIYGSLKNEYELIIPDDYQVIIKGKIIE